MSDERKSNVEKKLGLEYAKVVQKTQSMQNAYIDKSDMMLANMMQEAIFRITQLNMQQWMAGQQHDAGQSKGF